jgi:hypothetical protein
MTYEGIANTLVERIMKLIPAHPEILDLKDAWGLFGIDGFDCSDLDPSLAQACSALIEAKERYRSSDKRSLINELSEEREGLLDRVSVIDKELRRLELEKGHEEHPCSCVRLNRDIEVYDIADADRKHRRTLGLGFVSELLHRLGLPAVRRHRCAEGVDVKVWKTKDGRQIPIDKMADAHLLSVIRMLQRTHAVHQFNAPIPQGIRGEMAQFAAESDYERFQESPPSVSAPIYDDLCREAENRGLEIPRAL